MKDKDYIRLFREDNQRAITRYHDSCCPKFFRYFIRNFHKDEIDIEDLFQDSFLVLYDNILTGKLTEEKLTSSLYSYLLGIALNKMRADDRKAHAFSRERIPDSEEHQNPKFNKKLLELGEQMEFDQKHKELKEFMDRAVSDLTPPCDELLRLFYWNKLDCTEIAKSMNYSNAESTRTQKHKCMNKLKPLAFQFWNIL